MPYTIQYWRCQYRGKAKLQFSAARTQTAGTALLLYCLCSCTGRLYSIQDYTHRVPAHRQQGQIYCHCLYSGTGRLLYTNFSVRERLLGRARCVAPRAERPLIGAARFGRWREERFGRDRCLTLRYSLLLSVWVDPSAEHRNTRTGCQRTEQVLPWPLQDIR